MLVAGLFERHSVETRQHIAAGGSGACPLMARSPHKTDKQDEQLKIFKPFNLWVFLGLAAIGQSAAIALNRRALPNDDQTPRPL